VPHISARISAPNGSTYEVEIGVGDIAELQENMSVEILARRLKDNNNDGAEITASLTLDLLDERISVQIAGQFVGYIPLNSPSIPLADDDDVEGLASPFADYLWQVLNEHVEDETGSAVDIVDRLIEAFPNIDPLLVCLLKGAIGATVAQLIRCYQHLPPETEGFWRKLRWIARCMADHGLRILGRAAFRTFRCWARPI
jgi:hypothetical protein